MGRGELLTALDLSAAAKHFLTPHLSGPWRMMCWKLSEAPCAPGLRPTFPSLGRAELQAGTADVRPAAGAYCVLLDRCHKTHPEARFAEAGT